MRWVTLASVLLGCVSPSARSSLAQAVGAEAPREGAGNLRLSCEPEDAEVFLDGVAQGACLVFSGSPRGLWVGQGLHRIEVKKQGYRPYLTYYEPSGAVASLRPVLQPLSGGQGESR